MLKSAEEVRKIIDDKEYSIEKSVLEEGIEKMIRKCETHTYCEIKSPKLIKELKTLGYTVEHTGDYIYPDMYKISIC